MLQHSLDSCLWSPDGADITDLSLSTHHSPCKERRMVLRQYARAINSSFVRVGQRLSGLTRSDWGG